MKNIKKCGDKKEMCQKSQKIIIWCLIFSLLLPNFSISVFASDASLESKTVTAIPSEKVEAVSSIMSENEILDETAFNEENFNEKPLFRRISRRII